MGCRGGWCTVRESCAYYQPGVRTNVTLDRLCNDGETDCYTQVKPSGPDLAFEAAFPQRMLPASPEEGE
jgi:hypothetical protein